MSINPHGEIPEFRRRYRYFVWAVGICFTILVGRLWQMQMIEGDVYLKRSENNFIQEIRIPTVRGLILDRKGQPLVTNRPSFDVYVTPRFVNATVLERLIEELALTPDVAQEVKEKVARVSDRKRLDPLLAVRDINRDQLAHIEAHKEELLGVRVIARTHRSYIHGNLAAHILGYLNEVSPEELTQDKNKNYQPGDLVGRFGVERMFESHLRGVPGLEHMVVDARGRRLPEEISSRLLKGERRVEPRPGHNIILTIDIELQRLVERSLRKYPSGAVVILEVNTGRVLASASKPAFEPNILSGRLKPEEARRLMEDPYRPLLDKVYRENYYPGSTFKVIPAIAALEEELVKPEDTVTCHGVHYFGRRPFRCTHVHGKVNLHQAIAQSCNVYFYNLAEQVGMDTMARYAKMFGLGTPTGVGINGEVAGFVPTKEWYIRRKLPFRLGFTLNSAIGQGNSKATPIQIANLYAAIANGGTLYLPQIVERVETSEGMVLQPFIPRVRRTITLRPDTFSQIHSALHGVVEEEKGTATASRLSNIAVSGKTGTAQANRQSKNGKLIHLEDHSWFAAYAPSENPVIAVVVLIEHGGIAAKVAVPVAMEIIRDYFHYVVPKTIVVKEQTP